MIVAPADLPAIDETGLKKFLNIPWMIKLATVWRNWSIMGTNLASATPISN